MTKMDQPLDLLIERRFDAPVARVFRAWAEKDRLQRWWGPQGFTCEDLEMDFREGGAWSCTIVSEKHGRNGMRGQYQRIVPEREIVMSFVWTSGTSPETTITVTFREEDGQTVQTFHQVPFSSVTSRDEHIGGWSSLIEREAMYLAGEGMA